MSTLTVRVSAFKVNDSFTMNDVKMYTFLDTQKNRSVMDLFFRRVDLLFLHIFGRRDDEEVGRIS